LFTALLLFSAAMILRASIKSPERLTPVDRLVLRATSPVLSLFHRVGEQLTGVWSNYLALVGVKRDNERLRAENAVLSSQLTRLSQLAARAERMEQLLDLRAQIHSDTVAAQVIGVESSRQFRSLRIELSGGGLAQEVRPGVPVLAAGGLVGRVLRTAGSFADVQLATDPRSSIDVMIPKSGSRGVLKGISSDNHFLCRMEYVLQKETIQPGDTVVTSGLGGLFPREIPVGKVTRVRKPDSSLYLEIEVEPLLDMTRLREVILVLSPPPPPDPDAGKRPAEAARGIGVPR
jgi:rod shape-determining protein MreC